MSVTTTQYIRKPLYVDAMRITGANFDEVAAWCQGEVQQDEIPGKGTGKKYIRVRVHNPKNSRQTKAFVGDWLLYTERGYKVYTNKAFHDSFDEVDPEAQTQEDSENGIVVLGSEEILPKVTLNEAIAWLRKQPELTLEQIRELVQSGETCSSIKKEQTITETAS
jgi:hypothetical protein